MTKSSILALVTTLGLATRGACRDADRQRHRRHHGRPAAVWRHRRRVDLRDQNGRPAYHVQALSQGSKLDFLVDGRTGKVNPMAAPWRPPPPTRRKPARAPTMPIAATRTQTKQARVPAPHGPGPPPGSR